MSIHPVGKLKSEGVPHVICRQLARILLLSALISFSLSASLSVQYQVTTVGTTGTYQYLVSGFDFRANQPCQGNTAVLCSDALDIQFDPALFGQLSNGMAPASFNLLLFQPNNPPQAQGDYSALAIVDHASLTGKFSVDFTLTGPGTPGSQLFSVSQFNSSNGSFVPCTLPGCGPNGVITSGSTTAPVSGVPEPASFSLCAAVFIIVGVFLGLQRSLDRIG
jgi:hypothetical protein